MYKGPEVSMSVTVEKIPGDRLKSIAREQEMVGGREDMTTEHSANHSEARPSGDFCRPC